MNYSLSQKPKRPGHPEEGKVWIATPQSNEVLDKDGLIRRICADNPYHEAQLNADLVLLVRYLRRCLRSGQTVSIKGLGTFYAKFECEPLEGETAKGYNPHRQIKRVKAAWRPDAEMKDLDSALYDGEPPVTFTEVPTVKVGKLLRKAVKGALTSVDIQ
ncbi:MAG: hypothetical protein MJY59_01025 [Bacteroidaceae bacterium]|nr:hypothetical protein [Bacteroidaceae bacterium]